MPRDLTPWLKEVGDRIVEEIRRDPDAFLRKVKDEQDLIDYINQIGAEHGITDDD